MEQASVPMSPKKGGETSPGRYTYLHGDSRWEG